MPRLLTLWLDFGSSIPDQGKGIFLIILLLTQILGKKNQDRNAMKTFKQLNEVGVNIFVLFCVM